jgi:protein O-GlcNAc transferase
MTLKANGFSDEQLCRQVRAAFGKHGISEHRVRLMAKTASMIDHMAVYNTIDIALDTFPYNGTTTTCEALWMGVPTVTLAGQSYVSRMGVNIMTSVGLPEFIAGSKEEYVACAVKAASDLQRLGELRKTMRERMLVSPLTDATGLTKEVEATYRAVWREYVGGRADVRG